MGLSYKIAGHRDSGKFVTDLVTRPVSASRRWFSLLRRVLRCSCSSQKLRLRLLRASSRIYTQS